MNIVSNPSADAAEKIEHAAKILRSSEQCKEVFKAVYTGRKDFKSIDDIRKSVPNFNNNTYNAAARLAAEDIVDRKIVARIAHYGRKQFYVHNRDRILKLSSNGVRLKAYPTKRKHTIQIARNTFSFRTRPQAKLITIDDIDSFRLVRSIASADASSLKSMPERKINRAICNILNQSEKKDWGGERNDIYTNNVLFQGKRKPAAFALKGAATKGVLSPNKMGKKADQIQRLFEGTAELLFVVHHSEIDERVLDQMQAQAINKSVATGKKIYFCPINGNDLARLQAAYPSAFSDNGRIKR